MIKSNLYSLVNHLNLEIELLTFLHFGMIILYLANFLRCFVSKGLSWSYHEVGRFCVHKMYSVGKIMIVTLVPKSAHVTNARKATMIINSVATILSNFIKCSESYDVESQMTSISVIFTSTCHTKQLNSWPNSSASRVVIQSQLSAFLGKMGPFKGHSSTHGHQTGLRNRPECKQTVQSLAVLNICTVGALM